MIDEQSPASGHDYASNRWAIGAGVNKGVNNKLIPLFFLLTTFSHAGDSNEQK